MAERKRGGLGRGIGALIPTGPETTERPVDVFFPDRVTAQANAAVVAKDAAGAGSQDLVAVPGAHLANLSPEDIVPNPVNPRKAFDDAALDELVTSVREFGVLQPVVVRPRPGALPGQPQYELIMGERRLRASKVAGLESIPAIVRETADEDMLRDALLENLHRADLNPIEEAAAYQQLLEDFGVTQEQLATRIGRSRPQIANTIRLLRLPERVRQQVAAGVLSQGHARAILGAGDEAAMLALATKVVNEDLTVRATEAAAGLAAAASPRPPKPRAGGKQSHLAELANRLGDRLDTKARISLGAKKGQIVIDFATVADLNRILDEFGVDRS